jgi:hypothetical protein
MSTKPRVLFISTWINNPEFIPIQRDLIQRFCQEDVKFLAVLDGKSTPCFTNFGDTAMRQRQINICKENSIDFIEVPPQFHQEPARSQLFSAATNTSGPPALYTTQFRNYELDPSSRTAVSNQLGFITYLQSLKSHFDYLVMIQSDVFPFAAFSVKEMLAGNSLLYKPQLRDGIEYAWDGFLFFDFSQEPSLNWNEWNFENGMQNGTVFTDTGGGTWVFLPKIKKKLGIDARNSLQWTTADPEFALLPPPVREFVENDVRNEGDKLFAEIKHHKFIHLRGGGNWEFIRNPEEGIVIQQDRFQKFMECCAKILR